MPVKEAFGVHFFGIFWKQAVDNEVITIGAEQVKFG